MPERRNKERRAVANFRDLNKRVAPEIAEIVIWPVGPNGGCGPLSLNLAGLAQYNADPDLFVAKELGFATAEQYREWVESKGVPLCSERTRHGRLCKNGNGHIARSTKEWMKWHRADPCGLHRNAGSPS
jgi:hypothetical protein